MVTLGLKTSRMFPARSSLAGLIVMLAIIAGLLAVSVGSQSAGGLGKGGAGTALLSLRSAKRQQPELIASGARQQIQALLAEKESRSPVQQKIDSQLLYAIKLRRGESIAAGVQTLAVEVGADDAGLVTVDITAIVDEQLVKELAGMGIEVLSVFPQYHTLRAVASLEQLETIAGFPQVRFIQPKQEALYSQAPAQTQSLSDAPAASTDLGDRAARVRSQFEYIINPAPLSPETPVTIGSATSQGDTTHRAFSARGTFNTDGTGMKIGVLSDGVTNLATSQSTGDLGAVTVLPGQGGSGDEGTAMLEIIHDLAPGAQLFFATAGGGIANFAQNIRNLRSAGCDIIVDDVGYFVESPFQDGQTSGVISTNNAGLATQAVNDVVASGALYFSSAANSGNKNDGTSGTWEGDFVDGGTLSPEPSPSPTASPSPFPVGKVHDFDPSAAISQFDTITASGGVVNLHWSDPLGGSGNDYDLFVLNSTGTAVVASSTNVQNGTQDSYEQVSSSADLINNRLVIFQKPGAANRFLHLSNNRGRLSFNTDGDTHGHNAASGGYGVAAVCASCVYPSVFSSSNSIETFSSNGPRRIFFNGNSTPITPGDFSSTGGTVLQKPDVTAADGVSVSGAGGFPSPFFGTSAAAPHAAAIAALIRAANPALTPAQVKTVLTSTAIDIEAPGTDRDSGAGIVMPYAALQSMGAPVVGKAFLELSTITQTETGGNSNGMIEPGESGTLSINLNNTGLLAATGVTTTLTCSTSGVTMTNGNSAYPDLAAMIGTGSNTTPFLFSLSSSMLIDPKVNFTLTINYTGGHQPSQSWDFSVQFGRQPITTTLDGVAPQTSPSYPITSTGTQTGRLVRSDPPSTCAVSQPNPGLQDSLSHAFDSYTFTNNNGAAACVAVTLTPQTTALYQAVAYLGTYDPTNVTSNYLADIGASPAPFTGKSFSFILTPGQTTVIVVNEVVTGGGVGTNYSLQVSGLGLGTGAPTPTPTPTPTVTPTPSPTPTPTPSASSIVISQIYGGGGTPGATYLNSYLEIFNRGNTAIDLNHYIFLFGTDTGPFNSSVSFTSTQAFLIQPGQHRLIQLGSGGSSGGPPPVPPDLGFGSFVNIGLAGKIAIAKPGSPFPSGTCPLPNSDILDYVGFGGTANCFEGNGPTPALSNTTAAIRKNNGCTDTDNNSSDFSVGSPNLRDGFSPFNSCLASLQFSAANYLVGEGDGSVLITVNRSGNTSVPATVDFATSDGTATQSRDYELASGTLNFAAGETTKTFTVLIVDDANVEGNETLNLTLTNPTGGALASPSAAVLTITDNDSNPPTANPLDQARFFVQQHYYDFLSRFPDSGGWDFWTNTITQCGADQACINAKRIDVSNAFYFELEFQQTGAYVYRLYRAAFGNNQAFPNPNPDPLHPGEEKKVPAYLQFMRDRARVAGGSQLHQSQFDLANSFVQRPEFLARYPANLDGPTFVDALLATIKNDIGPDLTSQRPALIAVFNAGGRGAVMLQLADDDAQANPVNNRAFIDAEYNRAFVFTQYAGYLRRDADMAGFLFWLGQVNSGPLRDVPKQHAMVCSFITSAEYQLRFSPVVTRTNAECPQ